MNALVILAVLAVALIAGWWADERSTAPGWVRVPIMIAAFIIVAGFLSFTHSDGSPYP